MSFDGDIELIEIIKRVAMKEKRTFAEQIDFYLRAALAGDQNPDLPFSLIKEMINAKAQGDLQEYQFTKLKN